MEVTIRPSHLHGLIQAPASKSSMQRACAAALVAARKTSLYQPGHSNDDQAALDIIRRMGASVTEEPGRILIDTSAGSTRPPEKEIDCGESGLSIRMFTPLVALQKGEMTITGGGSLRSRPMDFFDTVLPQLGVRVQSQEGKLPLQVQGPLQPRSIRVDGSLSSQFLTGLLLAYAAANATDVTIAVTDLKSRPYIDLTLDVMRRFGLKIPENNNYQSFYFGQHSAGPVVTGDIQYTVEADWSGAAFLLVAGAIAGPILIQGLDLGSTQADKKIMEALMAANAGVAMEAKGIRVRPAPMQGFQFDATDCPDLFPPLVALGAYCQGVTEIKGVMRLAHKESNRALTLQEEFGKMGLSIEVDQDRMRIHGAGGLTAASVHSHHDHRIAMACAVAGLSAAGNTIIAEGGAVRKSYPHFFQDLKTLGADVSLPFNLLDHLNL